MIIYLGNKLSKHGKTASVIEQLTPRLSEFASIVSYSSRKGQVARIIDMLWAIVRMRRRTSLVIIDAFSSRAFWYAYFAASLCQFFKIPYIPILHGGDFLARLNRSPRAAHFVFCNSAMNISPSLYLKEHFTKAGFPVRYIPNFLEIENYPQMQRNENSVHLLWVRSFHQLYNPLLAIEVLAALKSNYPKATLLMVGPDKDGSMMLAKQRAIELEVENSVTFTGLLTRTEWIKQASNSTVFINTTNFDNMPISIIEAMALGLPVVSTNVGGLPYLITNDKDGILLPPCSVTAFTMAIQKIINDPDYTQSMILMAREKALSFDWSNVGPQWREIINQYKRDR